MMLKIRYTAPYDLDISGTVQELQTVRREILRLIKSQDVRIDFAADSSIDPLPYKTALSKLVVVQGQCPTKISLKAQELYVTGSPACLDAFASFFDFTPADGTGTHSHYAYYKGNDWIAPGSIPLVISIESQGVEMTNSQPQGFLAVPPNGTGQGVLVLHAWWGLNDTIKAFCTRLAESGFVAFAPDLYYGKVADTIAGAEALGAEIDANHVQAEALVAEAARFLYERVGQDDRGLAVIGFSLGGYYALNLAAAHPEHIRAVVLFYGTEGTMGADFSNSKAEFLGHFAGNDEYESQANVDTLEASLQRAGRPVTFYIYKGTGHWFFEPDRRDAYNPTAASLAWERTLAFLKRSPA